MRPYSVASASMLVEHVGQLGARDHAVLHEVVGRDAAHRREGGLARLPEQLPLGLVPADPHVVGPARTADRHHVVELRDALALGPVELDQQRRAPPDGVPGVRHLLAGGDRGGVHHLDRARHDAGLHDLGDRLAGLPGGVEEGDERAGGLGHRHHPQPHLRGDAERALGAHERAEQVVAGRVEFHPAEGDHLAVGQHDLEPGDVVGGEPVLEAVRAAGVLGDVAADRAHDLARRVGRVEEVRRDGGGDGDVRDAGFHADAAVVEVDVQDAGEPGQHDEHAVGHRQGPAGQPGAGAARHPGDVGRGARGHHVAHLVAVAGQHRDGRAGPCTGAARRTRRCATGARA